VILFHHLLQFAEKLADSGNLPPAAGLWALFILFSGGSLWLFHRAATRPGYSPIAAVIDRVDSFFKSLRFLGPVRRKAIP
jgi:hypothetical protein